jgi:hypothetical protein
VETQPTSSSSTDIALSFALTRRTSVLTQANQIPFGASSTLDAPGVVITGNVNAAYKIKHMKVADK